MKKKCLYCNNLTNDPHFESGCCGRGMCQSCFDSLQGTDEQIQIDYMDDKDWNRLIKGTRYENEAYVCFECVKDDKLPK